MFVETSVPSKDGRLVAVPTGALQFFIILPATKHTIKILRCGSGNVDGEIKEERTERRGEVAAMCQQ